MSVFEDGGHWTWEAPAARAVFTGRDGGISPAPWDSLNIGLHVGDDPVRVVENRSRAAALLELEPQHVAGVTQVHGADVWLDLAPTADLPESVRWDRGHSPIEADALVTTRTDGALAVGVADCVPIAIAWGDAIAAIHAGWRSLEQGVIEATMRVMRRAAGPAVALQGATPHAVVGPCIGPCCMEVGDEVAERFDAASVVRRVGAPRPYLDQRGDAARRLEVAGCAVEHVDACTVHEDGWFSHRAGAGAGAGTTGRQALLIRRIPHIVVPTL